MPLRSVAGVLWMSVRRVSTAVVLVWFRALKGGCVIHCEFIPCVVAWLALWVGWCTQHMELAIIRRESAGSGANVYNESETLTKYEVCDIAPIG